MQMIRCRCGADQWDSANYCSVCGAPIAALHHPILSVAHQPPPSHAAPPVQTIRHFAAGRAWRAAGFVTIMVGMLIGFTGGGQAGAAIGFLGFVAFIVGRLME